MKPAAEFEVTLKERAGSLYLEITGGDLLLPIFRNRLGSTFLASLFSVYRRRTDRQNRYIWGVVVKCVQGWLKETKGEIRSADEVYYMLRSVVGDSLQITNINGLTVPTLSGKRFSQMNTFEFSEAVEKIYRHFAEVGLAIPPPTGECMLTDYVKVRM